ncbi:TetR family transcriptional regulator [Microbacterium sp. RD1]|uniref:TetR family transcriptional regulator n=1 Tax=Microbacterium sp. RD1 TaxID=3457313 RepID=UPI003FA5F657
MPRWEAGSKERLQRIALQLFAEQGYENTSAVEISKRAGVTTRTFFRYFADKREVLFSQADGLRAALVEDVLRAPDVDEPFRVVLSVLAAYDWETEGPRDDQRLRSEVIAANPELLERQLMKQHTIALAMADALAQRGVDEDLARLATHLGVQVFLEEYARWLAASDDTDLGMISEKVLALLSAMIPQAAPTR